MRIYLLYFLFLLTLFTLFLPYLKEGFYSSSREYKGNLFDSTEYPCVGLPCIK